MSNDSSNGKPDLDKVVTRRFGFKKRPAPGFGHPARIILTLLLIFVSSQIAAALITQGGLSLAGKNIDDIFESAAAQFVFILIAEAIAVYLVFWVLRRRGIGLRSIGLGRVPGWKDLLSGFSAFVIFYIILAFVFALAIAFFPELQSKLSEPQEIGFNALNSSLDKILAFTALVILAPIGEEIMVRGYLFSGLRSHWKFLPAAVVTGIVFGAAHLQPENPGALVWGAALSTFILSFVLAYLRERTGALYSGMLVHGMNNAVAFTVYFTALSF
jgi:uncharacterized protein